jgi:tetratricopeptide (TPR) repeat protein
MVGMIKMQANLASNAQQALVDEAKKKTEAMKVSAALGGRTVPDDIDKAIAEYEALKRNPNDTDTKQILVSACYIRGLMFMSKEEYAKAIEDYKKAIDNEPNHPLALNKRGEAYLEMGNLKMKYYGNAIEDFEEVIQLKPNDAQAKQNLANAYMKRGISYDKKGDSASAAADFEMVLKYKPDDNTARELLQMARQGR